jgi:hypothetical protein
MRRFLLRLMQAMIHPPYWTKIASMLQNGDGRLGGRRRSLHIVHLSARWPWRMHSRLHVWMELTNAMYNSMYILLLVWDVYDAKAASQPSGTSNASGASSASSNLRRLCYLQILPHIEEATLPPSPPVGMVLPPGCLLSPPEEGSCSVPPLPPEPQEAQEDPLFFLMLTCTQ